jgi:tRNA(Ile2) C34 agmatinyltransferase TiaS
MTCPRCAAHLEAAGSDWNRCLMCGYEIQEDATGLYTGLTAAFEENPGKFFAEVRRHRDTVRALEPVWQRHQR